MAKRQSALLGCDSHLSVSRLISYISAAACDAGAAAELAASRKELKYAGLDGRYVFAPIPRLSGVMAAICFYLFFIVFIDIHQCFYPVLTFSDSVFLYFEP